MKHTKGEWKIDWYKGDFNIPTSVSVQTELNGGLWCEKICDILHGAKSDKEYLKRWKDETEANAKLIAAAPDLLKSLNECINELELTGLSALSAVIRAKRILKEATE